MKNAKEFVDDQESFDDDESLDIADFISGGNYLKNPAVGESVTFVLTGIKKMKAKTVLNPATKKNFEVTLSGKDVNYYYDFLTGDGKVLTVTAWQVVGKTKAILKKLGTYGIKMKISHVADGMKVKDTDAYKVYAEVNGQFRELSKETNEWI